MADYSIWVVEYARVVEFAAGHPAVRPVERGHDGRAVLLRRASRARDTSAVIDTGYNHVEFGKVLAEGYGVSDWQPADVVLKRIGIDPADVDTRSSRTTTSTTRAASRCSRTPTSTSRSARSRSYLWAAGLPDRLQWLTTATDPDLMLWLVERMKHGKLTLLEGETEILPGVRLRRPRTTRTRRARST